MIKVKSLLASATVALTCVSGSVGFVSLPALAQTSSDQRSGSQEDRVGSILGAIFGDRLGASSSLERQWVAGRKPLATQQSQFNTRIDADVRSNRLTSANGTRMKTEYDQLVALETRYGADNRFTTQERTELADRYGALTQALSEGGYAETPAKLAVAEGRAVFERRVDEGVSARRLSRTQATALKRDYVALIQTEASYARNGIDSREQEDLDARLDALDARVGDTAYGSSTPLDNRTRLSNIDRALGASGLSSAAQAQARVELGDLTRLEAAYSRTTPTSDDKIYLERRIVELENRARVRR